MSENIEDLKEEEKDRMDWQSDPSAVEMHTATPGEEHKDNRLFGLALITIGLIFLIGNLTSFTLNNWWAVFILIPGVMTFGSAWQAYKADGHFSKKARGSLIGGLAITLVAVIFLFNLDWGKIWPLFLILGGLGALLGGLFDS